MRRAVFGVGVVVWLLVPPPVCGDLLFSIGVRESDASGPVGSDGGTSGGIEWVGLDSALVPADGAWHAITFDLNNDPIDPFAGATANGVLETTTGFGVLEHLRIRNTVDGVTHYRVWIDEIVNTVDGVPILVTGFEGFTVGDEVVFQEPRFSGSTVANLEMEPNIAEVSDFAAFAGTRSYILEFEFVDDDDSRWVRVSSFSATNLPNPTIGIPGGATTTSTVSLRILLEENPAPFAVSVLEIPTLSALATGLLALLLAMASLAMLRR